MEVIKIFSSATIDTLEHAKNYYVPNPESKEFWHQTITISCTHNIKEGDILEIQGIESYGDEYEFDYETSSDNPNCRILKKATDRSAKIFQVLSVNSYTSITISPPIISNQGGSDIEAQYQNVIVKPLPWAFIMIVNTETSKENNMEQNHNVATKNKESHGEFITVKNLANRWQVCKNSIYKLIKEEALSPVNFIARKTMFRVSDILEYERQKQKK